MVESIVPSSDSSVDGPTLKPLRAWQNRAFAAWDSAGRRGIVAAATGTGKSRLALEALSLLPRDGRAVVVVPRLSLVPQWQSGVREAGWHPSDTAVMATGYPTPRLTQPIVIAVIDSARDGVPHLAEFWRREGRQTLLVVDECHWAGSSRNGDIFSEPFQQRLGLSATPDRLDDGLEEVLVPGLGEVVYRYSLRDALDDGLLAPLLAINVYIDLDDGESREYARLSAAIAAARSGPRTGPSSLELARRRLVSRASARGRVVQQALDAGLFGGRRALLFHERIADAEASADLLNERGLVVGLEHSRLPSDRRAKTLRAFKAASLDALVTVRTLDEGIDVPAADLGIIVSGGLQQRQRIQRIGRLLRPNGERAVVVTALARGTSEESVVGVQDTQLLGSERVRHHLLATMDASFRLDTDSTYTPIRSE